MPSNNYADWDAFVESHGGHLLQTAKWGTLKAGFGWDFEVVTVSSSTGIQSGAMVLFRPLPFGLGSLAYIPRGPVVDWSNRAEAEQLLKVLDTICRRRRAALLKIEPDVEDSDEFRETLTSYNLVRSSHAVQPPNSILLDIGQPDEAILARMNQGTRRKIKQAAQREVSIRHGTGLDDIESFNHLSAITGERDGFGIHSAEYFRAVLELFAPENASLLMASHANNDLAGLMLFWLGNRAWYLYGASSNIERERMPNYALQWQAIRDAREQGCTVYDLWGIPDASEQELEEGFQSRSDGLWGVYGFKRGFGGSVSRTVGAWDKTYNPLLYLLYRIYLNFRTLSD